MNHPGRIFTVMAFFMFNERPTANSVISLYFYYRRGVFRLSRVNAQNGQEIPARFYFQFYGMNYLPPPVGGVNIAWYSFSNA